MAGAFMISSSPKHLRLSAVRMRFRGSSACGAGPPFVMGSTTGVSSLLRALEGQVEETKLLISASPGDQRQK